MGRVMRGIRLGGIRGFSSGLDWVISIKVLVVPDGGNVGECGRWASGQLRNKKSECWSRTKIFNWCFFFTSLSLISVT